MIPLIGMHFMGRGAETIVLYCCVGIREREKIGREFCVS